MADFERSKLRLKARRTGTVLPSFIEEANETKAKAKIPKLEKRETYEFLGEHFYKDEPMVLDSVLNILLPKTMMNAIVTNLEIHRDVNGCILSVVPIIGETCVRRERISYITNYVDIIVNGKHYKHEVLLTSDELKEMGIIENHKNGIFYLKEQIDNNVKQTEREYKFNNIYNQPIANWIQTNGIGGSHSFFDKFFEYILREGSNKYINFDRNYSKRNIVANVAPTTHVLTDGMLYTFGIETECAISVFPKQLRSFYNVHCERDGSLNEGTGGPEYVSGVLKGDSDITNLQHFYKELAKRSKIDKWCSIHLHIGGFDFTKRTVLNLYLLCRSLEKELFSIMPPSRRKNIYCRTLPTLTQTPDIDEILKYSKPEDDIYTSTLFKSLFELASGGIKLSSELNTKSNHPKGAKCGYDKKSIRYCWMNIIPSIFSTRGSEKAKTVEFRLHSATLMFEKIYLWILICMAIVKYAENNIIDIYKQYTLDEVFKYSLNKKYTNITEYVKLRKEMFNSEEAISSEYEKKEYHKVSSNILTIKTIKELCV